MKKPSEYRLFIIFIHSQGEDEGGPAKGLQDIHLMKFIMANFYMDLRSMRNEICLNFWHLASLPMLSLRDGRKNGE